MNFDTFVPDHDPSLALPIPPYSTTRVPDRAGHYLPEPPGPIISQDEAFTRALDAMYWAGYYSAIYHVGGFISFRSKWHSSDEQLLLTVSKEQHWPEAFKRGRRR